MKEISVQHETWNCLCVALWAYVVILFYSQGPDPVYICFFSIVCRHCIALHRHGLAGWIKTLILLTKRYRHIKCMCIFVIHSWMYYMVLFDIVYMEMFIQWYMMRIKWVDMTVYMGLYLINAWCYMLYMLNRLNLVV